MSNELMKIETELLPAQEYDVAKLFTEKGADPLIEDIRKEVRNHVPDLTTDKGRKEIKGLARKVASTKIYLDDIGKDMVADVKANLKVWDNGRKHIRDQLDALKEEARAPLTKWEDDEAERKDALDKRLYEIKQLNDTPFDVCSDKIKEDILKARAIVIDDTWDELKDTADALKQDTIDALEAALVKVTDQEERDAEIAQLRADKVERDEKDSAAAQQRQFEKDAANKLESDKQDIIDAAQKKIDDANAEKVRAQERADKAAQDERDKIAAEKLREEAATKAREADREHRGKINKAALEALMSEMPDISQPLAIKIVTAIANNKIPHVTVNY